MVQEDCVAFDDDADGCGSNIRCGILPLQFYAGDHGVRDFHGYHDKHGCYGKQPVFEQWRGYRWLVVCSKTGELFAVCWCNSCRSNCAPGYMEPWVKAWLCQWRGGSNELHDDHYEWRSYEWWCHGWHYVGCGYFGYDRLLPLQGDL